MTRSDSPHFPNAATPPAAPAKESSSPSAAAAHASSPGVISNGPDAAAERVSPDSGPTNGLQLLSLNKDQRSGVNLVLLLPVCPGQTDRFPLPSAASPTLPLTATQAQPQQYGIAAPFNLPLLAPVNFAPKVKRDAEGGAPLDLSMKCSSPAPAAAGSGALPPVKSEPAPLDACGEAGESQTRHVSVNATSVKTETRTEESS